jgi:hypothetical protein
MIRKILQTARNYTRVSRNLADHGNSNFLNVFLRIILGRIFYGMGPDAYDRRRFSNKKLRQAREYLSLRERENLQKSLCPKEVRGLVEDKLRFYEKCLSHGLPTPFVNGVFLIKESYVPQGIPILRSKPDLGQFLDGLPAGRYIVKPIDGGHGWGISVFDIENGRVTNLEGRSIELDLLYRQVTDNRHNPVGYLFQEFVRQHPKLRPIMPGPGLGTFRLVTFLVGERSVSIPYAVVKIPVGNSVTDNFDAGYSGNWVCPVDVATGCLGNAVGKSDSVPIFSEIERRFDTGAIFKGMKVPYWEEVKSTIVKSALAFSDLRTLGWDIAVTDGGPSILETNWDWGENIIEVANNRGLKFELTELTRQSIFAEKGKRLEL